MQKFVYTTHAGDNTKFVYFPKMEQKANSVCNELSEIPHDRKDNGKYKKTTRK
jgi:hypothetical protein